MSEIKVNKISPKQTCTQLTLGDSGDTIIIPAGATITNNGTATGFGRTGTVDWDTTKKTTGFTAVSGVGYFCDTTSAAFTVTLPATPSAGAIVGISDYANTFATNNLIVGRNGSNVGGIAANPILSTSGVSVTLVYVDSTQGWIVTDSGNRSDLPPPQFVTATGGTITTCGDYKIHTFTGPGTFAVSSAGNPAGSSTVDYLVVAGGGGGGGISAAGGGGAGGFRYSNSTFPVSGAPGAPLASVTALPVTAINYPITVGSGGVGSTTCGVNGTSGNPSIFSTITSAGGGGGASSSSPTSGGGATPSVPGLAGYSTGLPGGSGGGTRGTFYNPGAPQPVNYYYNPSIGNFAGTGNTPPVSPPQGNQGGMGYDSITTNSQSGGGGGAMAVGSSARGPGNGANTGGAGGVGAGLPSDFGANGVPSGGYRYYSGGGGGGQDPSPGPGGAGGLGGGGIGGGSPGNNSVAGTTNSGGGGGGGGGGPSNGSSGGSGIVVIRYKFQ